MRIESAYIELTNVCNLNCRTCYNRSGFNQHKEQLPLDSVIDAIKLFCSYGLSSVLLSGGETMLYDEIEGLFDAAAKMPKLPFNVSTNGTVKQDLLLDAYRRIPNLYIQISLDGSCETVNAKTRGAGNFKKTLALLDELRACERKTGYLLKMVISQHNIEDVPAYFALAREYGCIPRFSYVNASGNCSDHWEEMRLTDSDKMTVLRLIDSCNKTYSMDVALPLCASSCPFKEEPADMKLGCMVKVNGDILPCQILYDERFRLGNIHSFDEKEILSNLALLHDATQKRMKMSFGCEKCMIEPLCMRGCPAEAYLECGDLLGSDGECGFRLKHYLKYELRKEKPGI